MGWKEDLERDGYARIQNCYSEDAINVLRAEAIMALTKLPLNDPQRLQCVTRPDGKKFPAILFWPKTFGGFFGIAHLALHDIVREALGDNVLQLNNQFYYRLPGDGDQFAWHQDICFRTPEHEFDQIETQYLQTIIVVDEMRDNGAIEFIPGSHKLGVKPLVPRDDSQKGLRTFERHGMVGEKVCAKPGDVLVWSVMTIHGSEPNTSQRSRMYLMNGFAAASAVKVPGRFPWYMRNGRLIA